MSNTNEDKYDYKWIPMNIVIALSSWIQNNAIKISEKKSGSKGLKRGKWIVIIVSTLHVLSKG